jgi:hypothetical protein
VRSRSVVSPPAATARGRDRCAPAKILRGSGAATSLGRTVAIDQHIPGEPAFRSGAALPARVVTQAQLLCDRSQPLTLQPGPADQFRLPGREDSIVDRVGKQILRPLVPALMALGQFSVRDRYLPALTFDNLSQVTIGLPRMRSLG